MKNKALLFSFLFLLSINKIQSQGCSDAGVCRLHPIESTANPKTGARESKHEIGIGTGYALGERKTDIFTLQLEYSYRFKNRLSVTGKLNFNHISGELAKTNGPGDLFLSIDKGFANGRKWKKNVFAGLKIPTGSSNKKNSGQGLPMVYQPSLGSTDLLAGFSMTNHQWSFALAYQQPLTGANNNGFLVSKYTSSPLAVNYPSTNQFTRKADLVARMSRSFSAGSRWTLQPGLLGIYHTGSDRYQDDTGRTLSIDGSTGLTLNALLNLQYQTSERSNIRFSAGTPMIVRAERPDGLTRKFVTAVEYVFRF